MANGINNSFLNFVEGQPLVQDRVITPLNATSNVPVLPLQLPNQVVAPVIEEDPNSITSILAERLVNRFIPQERESGRTGFLGTLEDIGETVRTGREVIGAAGEAVGSLGEKLKSIDLTEEKRALLGLPEETAPVAPTETLGLQELPLTLPTQENLTALKENLLTKKAQAENIQGNTREEVLANAAAKTNQEAEEGFKAKTPEEKSFFDTLTSNVDLTQVGLALLASQGNGQPLAANIGRALQSGFAASAQAKKALEKAEDKKFAKDIELEKLEILKRNAKTAEEKVRTQNLIDIKKAKGKPVTGSSEDQLKKIAEFADDALGAEGDVVKLLIGDKANPKARADARKILEKVKLVAKQNNKTLEGDQAERLAAQQLIRNKILGKTDNLLFSDDITFRGESQ